MCGFREIHALTESRFMCLVCVDAIWGYACLMDCVWLFWGRETDRQKGGTLPVVKCALQRVIECVCESVNRRRDGSETPSESGIRESSALSRILWSTYVCLVRGLGSEVGGLGWAQAGGQRVGLFFGSICLRSSLAKMVGGGMAVYHVKRDIHKHAIGHTVCGLE